MQRRSDDFSEQFFDPSDPKFWLRIEFPVGDHVVLTDFFFGKRDDRGMAQAFERALEAMGHATPLSILFKNLGPAEERRTIEYVSRIRKVVEIFAQHQGRDVSQTKTHLSSGQLNLTIVFKNDGWSAPSTVLL